jgi:hypothetical protein
MPTTIERKYFENGNIRVKRWVKDGKTHREDGPAFVRYNREGFPICALWKQNGVRHREDGKASYFYSEPYDTGTGRWGVDNSTYWLYGLMITEEWHHDTVELFKKIKTRNDALMHLKHPCEFIRKKCIEKLQ